MVVMALRKPELDPEAIEPVAPRQAPRDLRRWLIPIGGGLLAAVLIVLATPHVAWALRILLGVIALLYITGQSAAYLWTSDQG
jgi:hypothetical protein